MLRLIPREDGRAAEGEAAGRAPTESGHSVRKVLAFASVVELGTGLGLVTVPALVVGLLLGASDTGSLVPVGRVAGIALLALGLACWPSRRSSETRPAGYWGMVLYNVLIALYLTYLGTVGHLGGLLLWPAVALHAVVALVLLWTWRHDGLSRRR